MADEQEQLALGEVPNIAARLQGLAAVDTVLISEATCRLVQGAFTWTLSGRRPLRASRYHGRDTASLGKVLCRVADGADRRGVTPLVGRTSEVALLLERWQQSVDGQG